MGTETVPGLDLSFSHAPAQWWRARHAERYRIMVQNLWTGTSTPAAAKPNLANARAAGLVIAGYAVVNDRPGALTMEIALTAAGTHARHLHRLFTDAEEDPNTGLPLATLETIHNAVRHTASLIPAPVQPGVYSRASYWLRAYGDADATAPVWTAERNSGPSLAVIRYPWGKQPVIGKQRTGTTTIDGVEVDLNTFDATAFGITTKEEDDNMDQATFNTMHAVAHAGDPTARYDTIRAGGNCSALAARNGITLARLRQLNPGRVKDLVHKGDSFRVA